MQITLRSGGEMSVEGPAGTAEAVLFLPGISGKVLSERFQPVVDAVIDAGFPIARVEMWEGESDVHAHSFAHYHQRLGEVMDALALEGYSAVSAIGKSFGGGLLLSYHDPRIVRKILWAPAIGFTETDGNFLGLQTRTLGEIAQLTDITLDAAFVAQDPAEICIIHGTADKVIPLSNSEAIVRAAKHGALNVIESADHSYKDPAHEKELMSLTKSHLSL